MGGRRMATRAKARTRAVVGAGVVAVAVGAADVVVVRGECLVVCCSSFVAWTVLCCGV